MLRGRIFEREKFDDGYIQLIRVKLWLLCREMQSNGRMLAQGIMFFIHVFDDDVIN